MTSPCICLSHHSSVSHTNIQTSPSVCQSHQSSDHHTTTKTSLSICQTYDSSVCHTIIPTSLFICHLHDSSVCQPTHDSTLNPVWQPVCASSATSVLPSAKFTVKLPMIIPVQKFPYMPYPGKLPFIHT